MTKKCIVTGMLAIALFAFIVPETAFAKDKLTAAQVEQIYKTLEANPKLRSKEVTEALALIVKTMDDIKKDKSLSNAARDGIEDLLGLNQYYSMFSNTKALIGMSWDYLTDPEAINKGTKLTWAAIEWSAGLVLPGGYVRSITSTAKAALAAINNRNGITAFTNYATTKYYDGKITGECWDSDYMQFAQAWFAQEYVWVQKDRSVALELRDEHRDKRQLHLDTNSLNRIGRYIKALKTIRAAGLIK